MNRRITFAIVGLARDGSDVPMLEEALQHVQGVTLAYVNAGTEMAFVVYDPSCCDTGDLVAAVEQSGRRADMPLPR